MIMTGPKLDHCTATRPSAIDLSPPHAGGAPDAARPAGARERSAAAWVVLGCLGCVLIGSLVGTFSVMVISGCLGELERVGMLTAPGSMPMWQRGVGLAVVPVVAMLALRWALAPTGARRRAVGVGWLVLVVAINPLWNLASDRPTGSWSSSVGGSLRGLSLGPGGLLVIAAMVGGLVLLVVTELLGRRPAKPPADDRRAEPLNAAEVAAWIHRAGSVVVATTGPGGTPEVCRVAVAVTAHGRLIFDTDRDGPLAHHLAHDPRLTVLIDARPVVRVRTTATVVTGVERDQCLAVYLARFPDRLGRALSDQTAHVVLAPTAYDPV